MTVLLQDGVSAQAEAQPAATALVYKGASTSYGELEDAGNRLARMLWEAGCRPGDRVALFMPKMPAAITAMLGVLKVGGIYVPLDPGDAPGRLARIFATADCSFVLAAGNVGATLRAAVARLPEPARPSIGWLDSEPGATLTPATRFRLDDLESMPATAPPGLPRNDSSIAQILFTSGSTGTPKGVMVRHRNILHFIRWASAHFGIGHDDRISQHPPLRFDVSTFDVFGALWAGAQLHLVPRELNMLPHKLAQFIRDARLTQWFSVPSVLNLMAQFDVIAAGDFPQLRRVLFAGEVLPTPTLRHWMRRVPHASFSNLYGPTETTIASTCHTLPGRPASDREPIPIGRACEGESLLLLDENGVCIDEPNVVGDLCIRGAGVTAGYWRDSEKTTAAFVPWGEPAEVVYKTGDRAWRDADGLYYFVGRADAQVKCRGYRIELGEIETAVNALAAVRECAVVAIDSQGFEGSTICCAYASRPHDEVGPKQLRKALAEQLPDYMIPVRWAAYDLLPKNPNGKFDRRRITADFRDGRTDDHRSAPPLPVAERQPERDRYQTGR